jgi:hypothetical protein
MISEFSDKVPSDYADMWLRKELIADGELLQTLMQRYSSPQAKDRAERAMVKTLKRLREHVKAMPDREATDTREAVSAAVRGNGKAPARAPKNYGNMSDREFRKEVSAAFNYEPMPE